MQHHQRYIFAIDRKIELGVLQDRRLPTIRVSADRSISEKKGAQNYTISKVLPVRLNSFFTDSPNPAKSIMSSDCVLDFVSLDLSAQSSAAILKTTIFNVFPWSTGNVNTCASWPIFKRPNRSAHNSVIEGPILKASSTYVHRRILRLLLTHSLNRCLHRNQPAISIFIRIRWKRTRMIFANNSLSYTGLNPIAHPTTTSAAAQLLSSNSIETSPSPSTCLTLRSRLSNTATPLGVI